MSCTSALLRGNILRKGTRLVRVVWSVCMDLEGRTRHQHGHIGNQDKKVRKGGWGVIDTVQSRWNDSYEYQILTSISCFHASLCFHWTQNKGKEIGK